jgi:DNA-binding transcriptional regulator YdaS (Cro superfamily)
MSYHSAIRKAVDYCGGQTQLARVIGVRQQNVAWWLKTGKTAPEKCRDIQLATDGHVTVWDLRPDVFSGIRA